jgi:hypothetical protein
MVVSYNVPAFNKQRVAGMLFLLSLVIPILNWVCILSTFLSSLGNISIEIQENEFLFRFNILNQIISSICSALLGYLLHLILKPTNPEVSFFALIIKAFESIMILSLAILFLILLIMIESGFNEEPVLRGVICNYINITAISGIFLGLSMFLFSLLLYRSGIVPKWLAYLGIFSYLLVIFYDSLMLLSPGHASLLFVQIPGSVPVCVFQLTISMCFLFKKQVYESNCL